MPEQLLLTVAQAADLLAVCEFTVRRMVWRGDMRFVRVGRSLRIRRVDLDAWIEEKSERNGEPSMTKQRQSHPEVARTQ